MKKKKNSPFEEIPYLKRVYPDGGGEMGRFVVDENPPEGKAYRTVSGASRGAVTQQYRVAEEDVEAYRALRAWRTGAWAKERDRKHNALRNKFAMTTPLRAHVIRKHEAAFESNLARLCMEAREEAPDREKVVALLTGMSDKEIVENEEQHAANDEQLAAFRAETQELEARLFGSREVQ